MGHHQSKASKKKSKDSIDKQESERIFNFLEACNDFTTEEVNNALGTLSDSVDDKDDDEKEKFVTDYLEKGLAKLFVKMLGSLRSGEASHESNGTYREANLTLVLGMCLSCTDIIEGKVDVALELIKSGIVSVLLEELSASFPNASRCRSNITTMLMILDNCATCPNTSLVQFTFRKANSFEILMNYLQSNEPVFKTVSLFTVSRVANEEENDLLAATEGCISNLVELTRKAIQSEEKQVFFDMFGEDMQSVGYGLWRLVNAINRLATNAANKRELIQHEAVPVVSQILDQWYMQDPGFVQLAMEILWKLAFIEDKRDVISSHLTDSKKLKFVQGLQTSDNFELSNASTGLLWKLGITDIHSVTKTPQEPPPSYKEATKMSHIMISYQWDDQERAIAVRDRLKSRGYSVWIDVEKIKGNYLASMADAVEKAAVVLLCMSQKYKDSVNCQQEATYAYELRKPIIPLVMEDEYKADGWLGILTSGRMYYRVHSEATLEAGFEKIINDLQQYKETD